MAPAVVQWLNTQAQGNRSLPTCLNAVSCASFVRPLKHGRRRTTQQPRCSAGSPIDEEYRSSKTEVGAKLNDQATQVFKERPRPGNHQPVRASDCNAGNRAIADCYQPKVQTSSCPRIGLLRDRDACFAFLCFTFFHYPGHRRCYQLKHVCEQSPQQPCPTVSAGAGALRIFVSAD